MRLTLSRVTEADVDELVVAQYDAFTGLEAHDALFGPNTPHARSFFKKKVLKDMREDRADVWLKIVDEDTGRIVSASNWKIYPGGAPMPTMPSIERKDSGVEVLEEEIEPAEEKRIEWCEEGSVEMESAREALVDFYDRRAKWIGETGHVLLNILFTIPEYQRYRCGTAMVKWGVDLADRLFLPAWVEASPAGFHLYNTHGFEEVEYVETKTKKWTVVYTMMRRDRSVSMALR